MRKYIINSLSQRRNDTNQINFEIISQLTSVNLVSTIENKHIKTMSDLKQDV